MRRSSLLFVALLAISASTTSCKRRKPPALDRVWLGRSHGCALEKGGGLSCWGRNDAGQLGDGSKQDRRFATRTLSRDRPDALAIGSAHTCGLFGGVVRCWGLDVPKDLPAGGFTAIAAAHDMTCALHPEGARCWSAEPYRRDAESADWLKSARFLVGGTFFCAALESPKVVRCTGGGEWSPPAGFWRVDAELAARAMQRPDLLEGADVVSLATGQGHACAALADGTVRCWGENQEGQLGDGSTLLAKKPVTVVGLSGVASVHAGTRHTCARIKNGTVACWGDNHRYQLANGTTESSATPRAMFGLTGVQEVALAGDSSCVRLTDGMVKCWGANEVGQLGDGSTFDNSVPMPIKWSAADAAKR